MHCCYDREPWSPEAEKETALSGGQRVSETLVMLPLGRWLV
jgi:hypothetical protein